MFQKSRFFRVISIICLSLALTVFAFADTIRLKDGSIIKGKIISFDNGKFVILIDDGTRQRSLTFSANEVESIIFDSTPVQYPSAPTNDPNTKIITVGQTKPANNDRGTNNPAPVLKNNKPNTSGNSAPPITISIPVLADNTANGWTNSGWVVKKGQRIRVRASGRVALGKGRLAGAGGISTLPDENKLMKDRPTGSLIAVIGADNNDFIYIGESIEFTAQRDGDLFLGVNEGNLDDNSGSFNVVIEIDPN